MSHEITETDNMLSVIEVPWHGLGVVVDTPPTAEEAIKLAGLDWNVELQKVFLGNGMEIENQYATVRRDSKHGDLCLGIVGSRYTPLQNSEAFAIMDPLLQDGIAKIETCGSLFGGRKVWVMAKIDGDLFAGDSDKIQKNVLLSTTHDGSGAVVAMVTPTRVVCNNTLSAALSGFPIGDRISIRHTKTVKERSEAAIKMLQTVNKAYSSLERIWQKMAEVELPPVEQLQFIHDLFPSKEDAKNTKRLDSTRMEVASYILSSPGSNLESATNTLWGTYNAVTYMTSHKRVERKGSTEETHLDNLWFGRLHDLNDRAFNLAVDVMKNKGVNISDLISINAD